MMIPPDGQTPGLRNYNLRLEISVLLLLTLLILTTVTYAYQEMGRAIDQSNKAAATTLSSFFTFELEKAKDNFNSVIESEEDRQGRQLFSYTGFSDVYILDERLQLTQIVHQSRQNSMLYEGFSFGDGPLGDYLATQREAEHFSPLMRGYEDEQPSIYYAKRSGQVTYLGRLDLSFFESLLSGYSDVAGQTALITNRAGVVMISGNHSLRLPVLPEDGMVIDSPDGEVAVASTYLPALNARMAVLVPTTLSRNVQGILWVLSTVLIIGMGSVALLRNWRMQKLIIEPLEALSKRMDAFRNNTVVSDNPTPDYVVSEFERLEQQFLEMVSAVRDRESELLQAKQAAESSEQAKTNFLANMSHEIRSPLTVILGINELLMRRQLGSKEQEMLEQVWQSGQYLLHILNAILDLSKIEAGHLTIDTAPVRIHELLERIARQHRVNLPEDVRLSLDINNIPDRAILADAVRLEQILNNIIGNAIKFTSKGEVRVKARITSAGDTQIKLRIDVSDTGIGIDAKTLPHVFDPFTQADSGTTRRYAGTGLGLAISKQLIELMGGSIGVTSTRGRGSTFWFELPLIYAPKSARTAETTELTANADLAPSLMGVHALIVDDSLTIRAIIKGFLQARSATISLAENGLEALRQLRAPDSSINAVIMDMQMPVMDGMTATQEIRKDPDLKALPVIAITAGLLPDQREQALKAGVDAVIGKPIVAETLVEVILKELNKRH